jgi:hypothetical protein
VVLSRSWLLLSLPLAVMALVLLVLTVRSLLGIVRRSVISSVPIREEQRIEFAQGGDYALNLESSSLVARVAGIDFTLASADRGVEVPLHRAIFRTRVSSASRGRLELYRFTIPSPGSFVLRIAGVSAAAADRGDAIVFTRPYRIALVLHVVALVACGLALIGALVLSGFVLFGRSG